MAKRSISLPDDLDADVEQSARLENKSVSAWIADVVAPATKRTLGLAAVAEWEAELNDITNYTFGTRRAALMQNIDEARKAMAAAQRSIDDLEDQARRQGIQVTLP